MDIMDYMVYGGEHLSSPAKTKGFTDTAFDLFKRWNQVLDGRNSHSFTFIDLPLDEGRRLFVRALYDTTSGVRPVVWWIAVILHPEHYETCGGMSALHRQLLRVNPLEGRRRALMNQPIECESCGGTGQAVAEETSDIDLKMYKYGPSYLDAYGEFCTSISKVSVKSWFDRLFLAVNPKERREEFTTVFSQEAIFVKNGNTKGFPEARDEPVCHTFGSKKIKKSKYVAIGILVLGIGGFYFFGKSDVEKEIKDIQKEVIEQNNCLNEMLERFSQTSEQAKQLYNQVESLRQEVLVLKKKNVKLQERLHELIFSEENKVDKEKKDKEKKDAEESESKKK